LSLAIFSAQYVEHGGAFTNAAGGAARGLAKSPSSRPLAAVTRPATESGTDGAESGARYSPPRYLYLPSVVPNAVATSAAVPLALTQCRLSGVPVTLRPCDLSQADTA
jgi:hypothetical protein